MAEDASVRPIRAFCSPSQRPRKLRWDFLWFFFLEDSQLVTQHVAFSVQQHSCQSASQSYKLTPIFHKSLKSCASWSSNPAATGLEEENPGHTSTGVPGEDLQFLKKNNFVIWATDLVSSPLLRRNSFLKLTNFSFPIRPQCWFQGSCKK